MSLALNNQTKALYTNGLLPLERIDAVASTMLSSRTTTLNHAISTTDANLTKYEQAMKTDDAKFTTELDAYTASSVAPDLAAQLRTVWAQYQKIRTDRIVPASRRNDSAEVERIRDTEGAPSSRRPRRSWISSSAWR